MCGPILLLSALLGPGQRKDANVRLLQDVKSVNVLTGTLASPNKAAGLGLVTTGFSAVTGRGSNDGVVVGPLVLVNGSCGACRNLSNRGACVLILFNASNAHAYRACLTRPRTATSTTCTRRAGTGENSSAHQRHRPTARLGTSKRKQYSLPGPRAQVWIQLQDQPSTQWLRCQLDGSVKPGDEVLIASAGRPGVVDDFECTSQEYCMSRDGV